MMTIKDNSERKKLIFCLELNWSKLGPKPMCAIDAGLDNNVFWTWITIFDLVPSGGYFGCWSTRDDGQIIIHILTTK